MNIVLWILQVLLALHTAIGAVWKFSNSEQSVASLQAIPHRVWQGMSGLELICCVCLLLPALNRSFALAAPIAALVIAGEMLLFCGIHLYSGDASRGPLVYWSIAAVLCLAIAYGRFILKPH